MALTHTIDDALSEFDPATQFAFVNDEGAYQINDREPSDAAVAKMTERGFKLVSGKEFQSVLADRAKAEEAASKARVEARAKAESARLDARQKLNDSAYAKHVKQFGADAYTAEEWQLQTGLMPKVAAKKSETSKS